MRFRLLALAAVAVGLVTLVLCWALLTLWEGASALLEIVAEALERNP
ncbi:hypothetical protein [Arthrobacter sp. B1805]|nr:hypothetical protein [Arthrobacter sp. B1805]